ncbi:hypothetical protein GCM10011512_05240 [Tersicoccus solisilvae]|uniref:Uncharacterized protein n=1 Tax=Tersicoccus solisilvae TaxID=1882339 RepID=A0ABQ1NP66_9MICC|nr:hypothetical protein GCM10011512_05240 [Tersicoccus solisilvae]
MPSWVDHEAVDVDYAVLDGEGQSCDHLPVTADDLPDQARLEKFSDRLSQLRYSIIADQLSLDSICTPLQQDQLGSHSAKVCASEGPDRPGGTQVHSPTQRD